MNRALFLTAADWTTFAALLICELFCPVATIIWAAYGVASGVNSAVAWGPVALRIARRYAKIAVVALALR